MGDSNYELIDDNTIEIIDENKEPILIRVMCYKVFNCENSISCVVYDSQQRFWCMLFHNCQNIDIKRIYYYRQILTNNVCLAYMADLCLAYLTPGPNDHLFIQMFILILEFVVNGFFPESAFTNRTDYFPSYGIQDYSLK